MTLELELASILKSHGADFVVFTDISQLSGEQNRGFPHAIIFGIVLSHAYIRKLSTSKLISEDEFHASESKTDQLADLMAELIARKGYSAYSQSEYNLASTGSYTEETKTSPLPHKTIAGLAGLCGDCTVCKDICQVQAISGTSWNPGVPRDDLVNVYSCNSCLMCLALCPWTQEYMNKAYE